MLLSKPPAQNSPAVLDHIRVLGQMKWSGVFVECGTWLGACAVEFCEGALIGGRRAELHLFDYFRVHDHEVPKAAPRFFLKPGQNTMPLVKQFLAPFANACRVSLYPGPIERAQWPGAPISVFLLDAAKAEPAFSRTISAFAPSWIPGETVVGLMDALYYRRFEGRDRERFACQMRFIERNQRVLQPEKAFRGSSALMFRYSGGKVVHE
ncbi:MAG: hypothetical protein AB9869_17815 [Verrucomicrobiia bacterium]